ncbi:MAG: flagellar motor switch phosphatase FliY [Lachnospiraceae bacterium]|nr:flagellar motor switch phosphatase FliY [Lachnospiraceae bacterium]
MNDMLSQDEINALLNGMDLSESASADSAAPAAANDVPPIDESLLSEVEKDAVGEVANISMGSSATTLYSLVGQKVNITTPTVSMANWNTVLAEYEKPCVFIQIRYTEGLDGTNILVLKERDVKIITDLMMGGDGSNIEGELGELHLSAISEAMNQMMGSSATSLSTMLGMLIDISPPEASRVDLTEYHNGSDISPFLGGTFVKVSFQMQIGDLVDSNIMQLYPVDFAKKIVETFMSEQMGGASASAPSPAPAAPASAAAPAPSSAPAQPAPQPAMGMDPQAAMGMNPMYGMPMQGMPMQGMAPMGMAPMGMNPVGMNPVGMNPMYMQPPMGMPQQSVNVQPAQFQNFAADAASVVGAENIGLIMDVPLKVTAELGRTTKSIAEILDFSPGTIIELDRIAGEPIDVLVNGKFVARGEVIVIEESFGIRVTEIIK